MPEAAAGDVDLAVATARCAFGDPAGWPSWDTARWGPALERFGAALEKRGEQFTHLVSSQNGTPISIGRVSEAVTGQVLLRVKASGMGRELGPEGLAAFQQPKPIYLPA